MANELSMIHYFILTLHNATCWRYSIIYCHAVITF